MKVTFFFPDLRGGGVERVRILLAEEFLRSGYEVDFLLVNKRGVLLSQVPASVRVFSLDCKKFRASLVPLVRYFKLERPDVFVASMWPLTSISVLASYISRYRGKLILSEHTTLSKSKQYSGFKKILLKVCLRYINSNADAIVGISDGVSRDLVALGARRSKTITIHNPVQVSKSEYRVYDFDAQPWLDAPKRKRVLAVGRLSKEKGFKYLIDSFAILKKHDASVRLLVLGEGPERLALQCQIESLGLENDILLGGFVENPSCFYEEAGLFVLSSLFEGFGNVIAEALLSGVPVVATDCQSGPAEILSYGRFGKLVNVGDVDEMAATMLTSIEEDFDQEELRERGKSFSPQIIAKNYVDLFNI